MSASPALTTYPAGAAYVEALQHPRLCFADAELAAGTVETTPLGLPRPRSGAAACVFSVTAPSGRRLAVKCFTRAAADQQERYAAVARHLAAGGAGPWQVAFDYRARGVLVGGRWWPTVVMDWVVDGIGLAEYVEDHLAEPARLGRLATEFAATCADLRRRRVAHGDLQHGNVMVDRGDQIRLIDYDGMWVPELAGRPGVERGHPNYQSPRRQLRDAGVELDHFSSWVIYLSLLACAADATLWQQLDGGDECLLLRERDLERPAASPALAAMSRSEAEAARAAGARLSQLCRVAFPLQTPPLDPSALPVPADLPERRALPAGPVRPSRRPAAPRPVQRRAAVPVVHVPLPAPGARRPAPLRQSPLGRPPVRPAAPAPPTPVRTGQPPLTLVVLIGLMLIVAGSIFTAIQNNQAAAPEPLITFDAQAPPVLVPPASVLPSLNPAAPASGPSYNPVYLTQDQMVAESTRVIAAAPSAFPRAPGSYVFDDVLTDARPLAAGSGMQFASNLNAAMAGLGYRWDGASFFTACVPGGTHCGCSWQKVATGGYFWVAWEITASRSNLSSSSVAQLSVYWSPGEQAVTPRSPSAPACGAAAGA